MPGQVRVAHHCVGVVALENRGSRSAAIVLHTTFNIGTEGGMAVSALIPSPPCPRNGFAPIAAVAMVFQSLRADRRPGAIGNAAGFSVVHG